MIEEAINSIVDLAKKGESPRILSATQEPAGSYYLIEEGKSPVLVMGQPARHSEKLATPKELASFAEKYPKDDAIVFFDESAVRLVYDLKDRRDIATCALIKSVSFNILSAAPATYNQKEFVRLLRIPLRGCLSADSNLLPLVRNLKFTANAAADTNIQHGRESMGRSIDAQVTGESTIPEEVTLLVQVFENHPYTARVQCAIEVMTMEQNFRLVPYPLELRNAMQVTLESIRDQFDGDDMPPAFNGSAG